MFVSPYMSGSITPPHCSRDIERIFKFGDKTYKIPPNTDIAMNLIYLHEYNNIWMNDLKWRKENDALYYKNKALPCCATEPTLEHFLNKEGEFKLHDGFCMFGSKHRRCIGEAFAKRVEC